MVTFLQLFLEFLFRCFILDADTRRKQSLSLYSLQQPLLISVGFDESQESVSHNNGRNGEVWGRNCFSAPYVYLSHDNITTLPTDKLRPPTLERASFLIQLHSQVSLFYTCQKYIYFTENSVSQCQSIPFIFTNGIIHQLSITREIW